MPGAVPQIIKKISPAPDLPIYISDRTIQGGGETNGEGVVWEN